jgi:hypothetical protein
VGHGMLDVRDLRPPARPDASKPFAWRITALESSSLSSTMRVMSYPPISRLRWRRTKHLNVKRLLVHDDISGKTNPEDRRGLVGFPLSSRSPERRRSKDFPLTAALNLPSVWEATHEPFLSPFARRRIRPLDSRFLILATTRWRSAWGSTAKRALVARK